MTLEQAKLTARRISELWPRTTLAQVDAIVDALRSDHFAFEAAKPALTELFARDSAFFQLSDLREMVGPPRKYVDRTRGLAAELARDREAIEVNDRLAGEGAKRLAAMGDVDVMAMWEGFKSSLSEKARAFVANYRIEAIRRHRYFRMWMAQREAVTA